MLRERRDIDGLQTLINFWIEHSAGQVLQMQ